ncbi:MAG TPA: hypothetical protein VHZ03_50295 [Trebonia sp.]|jgi:hypothetical protein|nr:hypothetical protein [Trebonia sp.]
MYQQITAASLSTIAAHASTQSQVDPGLAAVAFVVCVILLVPTYYSLVESGNILGLIPAFGVVWFFLVGISKAFGVAKIFGHHF